MIQKTKWKIPLYKILTDEEDIKSVSKVIRRGIDWALGREIENFEKLLAKYIGTDYCLAFNSGTSALHAALLAVGIKSGNEIIVPSFTFIATPNSALMVNAVPKFVDIEEETYGLDPDVLEYSIGKKTKVIMPIHYAGLPCKIKEIRSIAKQKRIHLIEDAAESIGAHINKRKTGTFGDLSILSFAGNKVLTTGEGGAITTNSKQYFEKLKLIRSHGRREIQNYFSSNMKPNYITIGYNWRMSSITAALAMSQLEKIETLINLRRKNARYLSSRLKKHKLIHVPNEPSGYKHVYQLYSIRLSSSKLRNELVKFLTLKGIMSKVFFYPVHLTRFYKKMGYGKKNRLNVTVNVSNQILSLPMYPSMIKNELNYICDSIDEFIEQQDM
jgi:perosamine synthetase